MKKITLFILGIISIMSVSYAQGTGKLAVKKGQKLQVNNKTTTTTTQEAMGTTIEINADLSSNSSIDIKEVNDTKVDLSNTITHLDLNINMMGKEMKYDSDKKDDRDGEMGTELNKLINVPKTISLSKDGKQIKDPASREDKGAVMGGLAGDPTTSFENAFIVIPANAKTGTSWVDSSSEGIAKKSTTYTIREIKNNDAVIDIKGTLNTNGTNEVMGNEVKVTTTGTITGESIVDITTGIVKTHAITIESTGMSEIMGQEIPLNSKVISKTTITPSN